MASNAENVSIWWRHHAGRVVYLDRELLYVLFAWVEVRIRLFYIDQLAGTQKNHHLSSVSGLFIGQLWVTRFVLSKINPCDWELQPHLLKTRTNIWTISRARISVEHIGIAMKNFLAICWMLLMDHWLDNIVQQWFRVAFSDLHDGVIKWKHFPRYCPFVRRIHLSPVNSSHKGQWRGALMFSSICTWINGWVNNREAGDLRRNRADYDVIVMCVASLSYWTKTESTTIITWIEVTLDPNFISIKF